MHTMITNHHNYDNGYIALVDIELENIPEEVTVGGDTLARKSEFHVSIMAVKKLASLIDPENTEDTCERLKEDFLNFVKTHSLTDIRLTGEYRKVSVDDRVTLVAMVQLDGLSDLFDYLRGKYKVDLPTQPAHITLYTLQPDAGIGILSEERLEKDSVEVKVEELSKLAIKDRG